MLRGPGLLRSVLVSALDLAHVHAAPASQQRGPPRRLSRPKENPKQKRETRISTGTSCHRDARSARSCVWSLFFSLSQWHTPRRRRRGGARSLLRVRELPRCCACMLALPRCVLALQRLSNSARERAAALILSPAHATYRVVFGGLACDAVCWRWRCGPHARVLARGSFVCAWLMTGRDVSIVALVSLRRGIFNKTPWKLMHNHSAIAITSSGVGSRRKNMSSMVLGQAPAARALPLARGAREGGLVVVTDGDGVTDDELAKNS
jgi:hypothetical protein